MGSTPVTPWFLSSIKSLSIFFIISPWSIFVSYICFIWSRIFLTTITSELDDIIFKDKSSSIKALYSLFFRSV